VAIKKEMAKRHAALRNPGDVAFNCRPRSWTVCPGARVVVSIPRKNKTIWGAQSKTLESINISFPDLSGENNFQSGGAGLNDHFFGTKK
jgi:hypothetical protein